MASNLNAKTTTNVDDPIKTCPKWKTPTQQRIYSATLLSALRRIRRRDQGGSAVRETADEILAVSAKGKTRWSRAILTSRLSRRLCQINRAHKRAKARKPRSQIVRKVRKSGGLKKKVSLLGNLVPGCRKVSFPKLLEETEDYIAALEMQVRAMSVIAELLSGGAAASPPLV